MLRSFSACWCMLLPHSLRASLSLISCSVLTSAAASSHSTSFLLQKATQTPIARSPSEESSTRPEVPTGRSSGRGGEGFEMSATGTCLTGLSPAPASAARPDLRSSRRPTAATAATKSDAGESPGPDAAPEDPKGGKTASWGGEEEGLGRSERVERWECPDPFLRAASKGLARTEMAQTKAIGVRRSMPAAGGGGCSFCLPGLLLVGDGHTLFPKN
mmetsp:Transcript_24916/g.57771  ORF Transcript_24916/g.57771 Transcript_24916/m.57771 type:complete len:216 (+) Transcript_24916:367-1014(+)